MNTSSTNPSPSALPGPSSGATPLDADTTLAAAPVGFLWLDAAGRILQANPFALNLFKKAADSLLHQSLNTLLHPHSVNTYQAHWFILQQQGSAQCEVRPQGAPHRWLLLHSRHLPQQPQSPYLITLTDISHLHETQRDYEDAYALLNTLFTEAPLGLAFLDTDLRYRRVNPALAEINGLTAESYLGKRPEDVVPPDRRETIVEMLTYALQSQQPVEFELREKASGGTQARYWRCSYFPVYRHGVLAGVGAAVFDISDRKQAESALANSQDLTRTSEERFRTALHGSRTTVTHQNRDLRYTWIYNPPALLQGVEVVGKTDFDLYNERTARLLTRIKKRVLETEEGTQQEIHIYENQQDRFYNLSVEPFYNRRGRCIGITCAEMDITSEKLRLLTEREQRRWMEALYNATLAISRSLNLAEVLDYILTSVGDVVPLDVADIMLIENDSLRLVRSRGYSLHGLQKSPLQLGPTLAETPVLRQMMESNEPIVIADTARHEGLMHEAWLRSYMGVPMIWQHTIIGFLNLSSRVPNFYTLEQAEYLKVFASQAALAIRNAQHYEAAQVAAGALERQRLAADVYRTVIELMFSSKVVLESLERTWRQEPERLPDRLRLLKTLNRGTIGEMRLLLVEAVPEQLAQTPMPQLIQHLVDAQRGRIQVQLSYHVEMQQPLPPAVHQVFYRIMRISLHYISQYEDVTEMRLSLHSDEDSAYLHLHGAGTHSLQSELDTIALAELIDTLEEVGGKIEVDNTQQGVLDIIARWLRHPDHD